MITLAQQEEVKTGEIVWYMNPVTKDITYGVDGEDNTCYTSYTGLKNGVLAYPTSLSHNDIWFTEEYSIPEIKGMVRLYASSSESFKAKTDELDWKFGQWTNKVLAGKISQDGKSLEILSTQSYDTKEVRRVANFFSKKNLIKSSTGIYCNGEQKGLVSDLFNQFGGESSMILAINKSGQWEPELPKIEQPSAPSAEPTQVSNAPKDPPELLDLINRVKNKDQAAIEEIYTKFEKLIQKLAWNIVKTYNLKGKFDEVFQDAATIFLTSIPNFDPSKGTKFMTFITTDVTRRLKNSLKGDRGTDKNISDTAKEYAKNEFGYIVDDLKESNANPQVIEIFNGLIAKIYSDGSITLTKKDFARLVRTNLEQITAIDKNLASSLFEKLQNIVSFVLGVDVSPKTINAPANKDKMEDDGKGLTFDKMPAKQDMSLDPDKIQEFSDTLGNPKLQKVFNDWINGVPLQSTADEVGVSKQRVQQIQDDLRSTLKRKYSFSMKIEAMKLGIIFGELIENCEFECED